MHLQAQEPAPGLSSLKRVVTFGLLLEALPDNPGLVLLADLEWKLTYVGSAESEKYDQELDSVLVGPVVRGQYRFIFQVRCHPCIGPLHTAPNGDPFVPDVQAVLVCMRGCASQQIGDLVCHDRRTPRTPASCRRRTLWA